jgi:hypothetical protein
LLRSGADVLGSYASYDQLKKMRQAYLLHVLDHVLKERHQVHLNNVAVEREENPYNEIRLDTVFDIAK